MYVCIWKILCFDIISDIVVLALWQFSKALPLAFCPFRLLRILSTFLTMRRTIKSMMMTMLRWLDPSGFVYRMGLKWVSLYFSSHRVWFSTFVKFVSHFCINKLLRTSLILAKLQKKTALRKKCRAQIYSALSLSILFLLFKMMASTLTNFVCLFENVATTVKNNKWKHLTYEWY